MLFTVQDLSKSAVRTLVPGMSVQFNIMDCNYLRTNKGTSRRYVPGT
jgi:hypothetical protein